MNNLMLRLWHDDGAYILTAESIFLFTIVVLGLVTAFVGVRNAVVSEMTEIGNSLTALDQSYSFCGLTRCCGFTAGSAAFDTANTSSIATFTTASVNINSPVCP